MASHEKDLFKKDLNEQVQNKNVEGIKTLIDDMELMGGHEDIVALANEAINKLTIEATKVNQPVPPIPASLSETTVLNNSDQELKQNEEAVKETKETAQDEIEKVGNQTNVEVKIADSNISAEDMQKESERTKKIEELSNKRYDMNRQTENEIKSTFNELIDKYSEDMQKAEALLKSAIHEENLDKLIALVRFNQGSIKYAISELNSDDPVSGSGDQRRKIEVLDKKIEASGMELSKLYEEAKQAGEKDGEEASTFDDRKQGWGNLRNRMAQSHMKMGPQGRELRDKLTQQEKNVEEKIKTRAGDFLDTQDVEIGKYKRDVESLPEKAELSNLRGQMTELEGKKTGMFFSAEKKNKQKNELQEKINANETKVNKFKMERKKEIINSLEAFKEKFSNSSVKYDESKYSKLYSRLNEI